MGYYIDDLKLGKNQSLRHNEYYDTQKVYDELYSLSKAGKTFNNLIPLIMKKENILLAYRNIKANKGSKTAGIDNKTIADIEKLSENNFITLIQNCLKNYIPQEVKRVEIPKPNGKTRPLGIPTIRDRIIQQAIKQVIEPIAEAKFYKHSYGFRPERNTSHAIARFAHLINHNKLYFVIDIDIKGFFDNVNHGKLLKQFWTIGIRDKNLIKVISKMLKAPIENQGKTLKGTPQGAIISPLLSNIVLNELDWWISSQWENIKTEYKYKENDKKYRAIRKTSNLKECFIVRYADDFKVLCRTRSQANKLFIAIKEWLKDRLKLEISEEKSKITNLKKRYSEFLGFKIKAVRKGKKKNGDKKYVANAYVSDKAVKTITKTLKEKVRQIPKATDKVESVLKLNAYILGIHNYYRYASHCNKSFAKIGSLTRTTIKNRLKPVDVGDKKTIPKYMHSLGYDKSKQLRSVYNIPLLPITYIQTKTPLNFSQLSIYVKEDREKLHKEQKSINPYVLNYVMRNSIKMESIQYNDNRISRLVAQYGVCGVTGQVLEIDRMECHHIKPKWLGGTDDYKNLLWVTYETHKLIHARNQDTIGKYLNLFDTEQLGKINKYRKLAGNEPV